MGILNNKQQIIGISILVIFLLVIIGVIFKETYQSEKDASELEDSSMSNESEFVKDNNLYGIWKIDSVALQSEMYTGTTQDGVEECDLYEPEDFIGCELEYTADSFRLGDKMYQNPIYQVDSVSFEEYDAGGKFIHPGLYGLEDEIHFLGEEGNTATAKFPAYAISFYEEVTYDKWDFIPLGTEVIMLNENVMLLGYWGKIMLAYRVE